MFSLLGKSLKAHVDYLLFLFLTFGTYFTIVFWKILTVKPDGLYAGHVNAWSDWSLHIAIANIFAFKSPGLWFAYHPLYSAGKFTYPFVSDMISGFLMRFGLSLKLSFFLPSILLVFTLLTGLYFLFYLITHSKKMAFGAIFIFFLSAGLGFFDFIGDLTGAFSSNHFVYPEFDYGRFDNYQWYSGNVVVGLLIPQRAFLMGLALGVWSITGALYVILRDNFVNKTIKLKTLVIAGILAGVLPVVHPHSFIAVVVISGSLCLFNVRKWKLLWPFVAVAGILSSLLYYVFIWGGIESDSFMSRHIGYTSGGNFLEWLKMWIMIWGAMLPVVVLGLYYLRKQIDWPGRSIYFAALALFGVGNLFYFQPIAWDNSKIFWWAYMVFSSLAVMVLGNLWKWNRRRFIVRMATVILFFVFVFTGFLDLIVLAHTKKHEFQMTSIEDIELGVKIRNNTDSLAVFLTAPSHNHFIMVWALRPIVMGYIGWVWNYGFDYWETETDIKKIFSGENGTEQLLEKYNISYVVIGPGEIRDFDANDDYFRNNFPLAFQNENYRVYDVR